MMLEPGAVIGIVGGGQLGRMMALAAYRLGFRVHVFCQDENEPLAQITPLRTLASFDNAKARDAFAQAVDVITIEFENLPDDGDIDWSAMERPLDTSEQQSAEQAALQAQMEAALHGIKEEIKEGDVAA